MAKRLDAATEQDIWEVFHRIPYISIAKDAFLAMVLQCPVKVKLRSFDLKQSEELEFLLERHWLEWKKRLYVWLKMFGICPWYFKKIPNTVHRYPVVPPFRSGHITTFINKKHEQGFRWTWMDGKEHKKMHFEIKDYAPTILGEFTTPIVTLLDDYRSIKIARESTEIAWRSQAHPQHILEFHESKPPMTSDDVFVAWADPDFSKDRDKIRDNLEKVVDNRQHLNGIKVRGAQEGVAAAILNNKAKIGGRLPKQYLKTDDAVKQFEMENAGFLGHIIPLPADYTYKTAAVPKVDARLDVMSSNLDARAAAIMDFPIQMMSATARTVAQAQNNLRNVNERVKNWITFFEQRTKNALLLAYGDVIQDELDKLNEFMDNGVMFSMHKEVIVEMECTPVTSYDELRKYVADGIMDIKDFAKHVFNLNAIPASQISIKRERPEEKEESVPVKKRKKDKDLL